MPRRMFAADMRGWDDVAAVLEQLAETWGEPEGERVIINALKEACKPVVEAARRYAPVAAGPRVVWSKGRKILVNPGHLRRSILVEQASVLSGRGKRYRTKIARTVTVGAFSPHAHLIEYGTGPRRNRAGAYRGQVPPHPFMRVAWALYKNDIPARIRPALWKHLQRRVRQLRRKDERLIASAGVAA